MHHIIERLKSEFLLSKKSIETLLSLMETKEYPKKTILMKPGVICSSYFFIEKGLARSYILSDGAEISKWFAQESDIIYSMPGSYFQEPGIEFVELIEDATIHEIKIKNLNTHLLHNKELFNWTLSLKHKCYSKLEKRYIKLLTLDAKKRYDIFRTEHPDLHNRINLGHLASFLGMTQVTLSRIRGQ